MNQKSCKNYSIKLNRTVQSLEQRSLSLKHFIKERSLTDICDLISDRPENVPKYLNRLTQQGKPSENGGLS